MPQVRSIDFRFKASEQAKEAAALQAAVDKEGREMTPAELSRIDDLLAESAENLKECDRRDRLERHLTEFEPAARPNERLIRPEDPQNSSERRAFGTGSARTGRTNSGRRYADMFPELLGRGSGFRDGEDFLKPIVFGQADPRLLLAAGMTEGGPGGGGFLVPSPLSEKWLDASLEEEVVRGRAQVHPMTSSTLEIAGLDVTDRSAGDLAGYEGQWLAEGAPATEQKARLRKITLKARKCAIFTSASVELATDAIGGFEGQIGAFMSKAIAFNLDGAFLGGTGAGQPLGILNGGSTVTVLKEGSQAAATIRQENVLKMFARLIPASQVNAVWVVHPSTIPQLYTLTVLVKNVAGTENVGGAAIPLFRDEGGRMTLLGRPVLISEKAKQLGTKGDIGLYDFSYYAVGIRSEMSLERSNAPGWLTSEISLRLIIRVDGQPILNAAVKPSEGTDALSPFVTLETRA